MLHKSLKITCLLFMLCMVQSLQSQQILLDLPVKAGELTLFPDLTDRNSYYYLSDKPRIAVDASNKPQFSFLKYAFRDKRAGTDTDGGGIVHAVIQLAVTDEQLNAARQELRRVNSSGVIKGPIVYRGGTIALISSFAKADGELSKQVLGIGKAPILDGQKAAISVQLTKRGAEILWESFKTPTPDMSVSFEMEVSGFRSPKRAIITANFDQIYEHQGIEMAAVTPVLAAEIKLAFDDLYRSGAIKVEQIGEDEDLEKAVEDAYSKLTRMMFEASGGGTGVPNLGQLTGSVNQQSSMLDRATTMLNRARRDAQNENRQIRAENANRPGSGGTGSRPSGDGTAGRPATGADTDRPATDGDAGAPADGGTIPEGEGRSVLRSRRGGRSEISSRVDPDMPSGEYNYANLPPPREEVTVPMLAVAFSYELRRVRQRGEFRIDLNKYSSDNLTMRFDENFGQIKCADCYREVFIDDPLFKQRPINVFIDGLNAQDFDKYINSVTVMMRKKHESGELSTDEVTIDRSNFNAEGNNFTLLYGWKNDNNRQKWFNYDTRTVWNFFGGLSVDTDWSANLTNTLPLSPPYLRRFVDIEADPGTINTLGVRAIEVKFYEKLGEGKEQIKQIRLNPKSGQMSGQVELVLPRDKMEYEYECIWYMNNGTTKSTGRKPGDQGLLFVDTIQ